MQDVPGVVQTLTSWTPRRATVRNWVKDEKIDGRKIGGRWFVNRSSLEQFLFNARKEDSNDEVQADC